MAGSAEAVLLMTHFLDSRICGHYRRLAAEAGAGRDVFILYNRDDDPDPSHPIPEDVRVFAFSAADIRSLGFPHKGRWLSARDVELFALLFALRHPNYRHVWAVEYDVAFTGRWHTLFDAFAASPADLLATTIHRYPVNPGWDNWASVRTPDGRPPVTALVRAFLPCCRFSRRAVETLVAAYDAGWEGHYEATVPTILLGAGLILEDIGGDGEFVAPGNLDRFYRNTPGCNSLSPGTFVFRPVRVTPGTEPGRLWHPVKPLTAQRGWATGRRAAFVRWVTALVRAGMARLA
jgi:hypothetical protein